MEPLEVTALLWGRLILPSGGYMHLDGLLAWAVWARSGEPPALDETQVRPIEIPVQRSACGRYHLASASSCAVRMREKRWLNKRFPVEMWQMLGAGKSANRIQISAGPSKGFRIPMEAQHLEDHRITWWCIGERAEIEALLSLVTHLGRRRGVGEGEVREWRVEPCEPWGPGFPVVDSEGSPLRHLPLEDSLITGPHVPRIGTLTYPYHAKHTEGPIAAPLAQRRAL